MKKLKILVGLTALVLTLAIPTCANFNHEKDKSNHNTIIYDSDGDGVADQYDRYIMDPNRH